MKKTLFILLAFTIALSTATAQTKSDTIPFTLNKQHNICIKASVNGSETLTLMFHSSSTGVTLTKSALEKKITLNTAQSSKVKTWGGSADAEYSEGNSMNINQLSWNNLTVFINENSGEGTDGKFGHDLFAGKILEIDYDHQRMIVHATMPKISKRYHKTTLIQKNGTTYITGALKIGKQVYRDTFMFHTGYGGAVLLDPKIGERYGMQSTLTTISTSELKDSYGNVFKIDTKLLPQMQVGGKKLKNVPLSFAARSSEIPMKVFGNGLLRRFNVVFDFQKKEMYLRPNGFWETPF
jgi:Aspartyl protease